MYFSPAFGRKPSGRSTRDGGASGGGSFAEIERAGLTARAFNPPEAVALDPAAGAGALVMAFLAVGVASLRGVSLAVLPFAAFAGATCAGFDDIAGLAGRGVAATLMGATGFAAACLAGATAFVAGTAAFFVGAATFFAGAGFGVALRAGGALFLAGAAGFLAGAAFFAEAAVLAGAAFFAGTDFFAGAAFFAAAALDFTPTGFFVAPLAAGFAALRVGAGFVAGLRAAGAAFLPGFTSLTSALAIFFTVLGLVDDLAVDLDLAGAFATLAVRAPLAAGGFLAAGLAADFLALLVFAATLVPMILGAQRSRVIA
jgi:hypothetical protein